MGAGNSMCTVIHGPALDLKGRAISLPRADGIHMHLKSKNLATAVYGPFLPFTGVILCYGHCIGSIRF